MNIVSRIRWNSSPKYLTPPTLRGPLWPESHRIPWSFLRLRPDCLPHTGIQRCPHWRPPPAASASGRFADYNGIYLVTHPDLSPPLNSYGTTNHSVIALHNLIEIHPSPKKGSVANDCNKLQRPLEQLQSFLQLAVVQNKSILVVNRPSRGIETVGWRLRLFNRGVGLLPRTSCREMLCHAIPRRYGTFAEPPEAPEELRTETSPELRRRARLWACWVTGRDLSSSGLHKASVETVRRISEMVVSLFSFSFEDNGDVSLDPWAQITTQLVMKQRGV